MLQRLLFDTAQARDVKKVPLFAGMPEAEQDLLFSEGCLCSCPRKKTLFRQGDAVTHFYIICSGTVRLSHETPDGCEITTDILGPGDTLCAAEIFQQCGTHRAHATAVTDVTVMEFPRAWLEETMQKRPLILRNMLSLLARQSSLREAENERQSKMTSAQLIACFLQHVDASHGFDSHAFELPYSKSLISTRLGMELETFSRSLSKLKELGVTVKGKHVRFHDVQAIDRHVCGHCSFMDFCTARVHARKK